MASAQTEPSMDEILASIRRIISEEDDAPQEVPVRQKLETLQLRDADEAPAKPEEAEASVEEEPVAEQAAAPEPAEESEAAPEPEAAAESGHVAEAEAQADAADDLDDFGPMPEEPVHAASTMEPAASAQDEGETTVEPYAAEPAHTVADSVADAVRPAAMAAAAERLSVSEAVAGQAASAFGALEENMRLTAGSGRTIEDLVEAMLAPMLKEWLDANLPRIVEDKVEEEVRRISRRR